MAERLALERAHASHLAGSDYVATTAVQVRYASAIEVQIALTEAPTVISSERSALVGQGGRASPDELVELFARLRLLTDAIVTGTPTP
jgi:hypothetical protein